VKTFPNKKRINTELFIGRKHRLFIYKNDSRNVLAELKRVNVFGGQTRAGMRTQNNSLSGMTYLREGKTS